MLVKANIGSTVEKKTSKAGKPYAQFRAAENFGKEDNRTTTWFNVMAFIDEDQQDMLGKGDFVEIEGRLVSEAYPKKDGSGMAVSNTIMAFRVEPAQRAGGNGGNRANSGSNEQGARAPSDRPVYEGPDDDEIPF
jgi:single-stranded DNA-binding protein